MNKFRFIWRAWSYRISKDPEEIKCILRYLSAGEIAVDIGANKGGYTYWMAKAVGGKGKVFAFEPQQEQAKYLQDIVNAFGYKMVKVEQLGLSSITGEAELVIPEQGKQYSPGATFEINPSEEFYSYKVNIDTLDRYFGSRKIQSIRFIKCDVEGHELEVFKGGENILRNDHPTILFECESRHLTKHKIQDVFKFLEDFGYEGYFFLGKKLIPVSMFDEKKHQAKWGAQPYFNNFLFKYKAR